MVTIKSYTDIEQSKKLAEILPLKSADMCWFEGEPFVEAVTGYEEERAESHRQAGMEMYPCWSLSALLGVLPKIINHETLFIETSAALWHIGYRNIYTARADNPVDACFEMILKLKENNLL